MDSYYTPWDVATALVSRVPKRGCRRIADFAAGDGQLLRAASAQLEVENVIAVDLDARAAKILRSDQPDWRVARCDFTKSDRWPKLLQDAAGTLDLVLLNPPFSYRGNQSTQVRVDDKVNIRCSPAMGFLVRAVAFLRRGGRIAFLLPAGSVFSQKDSAAREWLRARGRLQFFEQHPRGTFANCTSAVVAGVFHFTNRASASNSATVTTDAARLVRGTVQMHSVRTSRALTAAPLVHTTDLRDGEVAIDGPTVNYGRRVNGPAVLLPRVGKPAVAKVTVHRGEREIVLSDCVVAIECVSTTEARRLRQQIERNWKHLAVRYGGTCARYITMRSLGEFLSDLASSKFAERRGA